MKKSPIQSIYDFLLIPLRFILLPDSWCEKIGLTSLEEERIYNVLPHIKGKLLDVGCGNNRLVNTYGNGVGVEVYDWGGGAVILQHPHVLPFKDKSFDTITLLASLNHVPAREKMLQEVRRVIKDDGRVIITMINPFIGYLVHTFLWHSEDKDRGMVEGEVHGIWSGKLVEMFGKHGFQLSFKRKFEYGINSIFIFCPIVTGKP